MRRIRPTTRTRPLSRPAMGIYDGAKRRHEGNRAEVARFAEKRGLSRKAKRHQTHGIDLQSRLVETSRILRECEFDLTYRETLDGTQGQIATEDLENLRALAQVNYFSTIRSLGFYYLGSGERRPAKALRYFEIALTCFPFDIRNLYALRAGAALYGIKATLEASLRGIVRTWRYIKNAEAYYYTLNSSERLKADHWSSIEKFEALGDEILKTPYIQIGEFSSIFNNNMINLFGLEAPIEPGTINAGDVVVDTNVLILMRKAEKGFTLSKRERRVVDFCRLVSEHGGRFFIVSPQIFELRRIAPELISDLKYSRFSSLAAFFYGRRNGRMATVDEVAAEQDEYGKIVLKNLLDRVGGLGGVADAMIVAEAQLADSETPAIPLLTMDKGIIYPLAKRQRINNKDELVDRYGNNGLVVSPVNGLGKPVKLLAIYETTDIAKLYDNLLN